MESRSIASRLALLLPLLATACVIGDTASELVDAPAAIGGSFGRFAERYVPLILDAADRAGYHSGFTDDPEDVRGAPSTFVPRVSRRDRVRGFYSGDLSFTLHAHDPGNDNISRTLTLYLELVRIPRDTTWYLLTEDGSLAWHEEYELSTDLQTTIRDVFPDRMELAAYAERHGS